MAHFQELYFFKFSAISNSWNPLLCSTCCGATCTCGEAQIQSRRRGQAYAERAIGAPVSSSSCGGTSRCAVRRDSISCAAGRQRLLPALCRYSGFLATHPPCMLAMPADMLGCFLPGFLALLGGFLRGLRALAFAGCSLSHLPPTRVLPPRRRASRTHRVGRRATAGGRSRFNTRPLTVMYVACSVCVYSWLEQ